jgi:hypothetical protein
MPQNSVETWTELSAAVRDERDPRQISDLIEQLNRDLAETEKNASHRG